VTRRLTFNASREPIELELGGEVFTAHPVLAPATLGALVDKQSDVAQLDLHNRREKAALDEALTVIADIYALVLVPESTERFRDRLFSQDKPLDLLREVLPAIPALVREYTGRPTQPSPASSDGSATTGTPSTDGAPAPESIPSPLQPTVSAT
jgi:hypothetical protein